GHVSGFLSGSRQALPICSKKRCTKEQSIAASLTALCAQTTPDTPTGVANGTGNNRNLLTFVDTRSLTNQSATYEFAHATKNNMMCVGLWSGAFSMRAE